MDIEKALAPFLDADGRLTALPAKRKTMLCALCFLAARLEPGRTCTEAELGDAIDELTTFHDPAAIRRELCSYGFLTRRTDGSEYRIKMPQPTPESLGLN